MIVFRLDSESTLSSEIKHGRTPDTELLCFSEWLETDMPLLIGWEGLLEPDSGE